MWKYKTNIHAKSCGGKVVTQICLKKIIKLIYYIQKIVEKVQVPEWLSS